MADNGAVCRVSGPYLAIVPSPQPVKKLEVRNLVLLLQQVADGVEDVEVHDAEGWTGASEERVIQQLHPAQAHSTYCT